MAKDKMNSKKGRYGRVLNVPILGFIIDFIVAFFRIARNDDKVRELRRDIRRLSASQSQFGGAGLRRDGLFDEQALLPHEDSWNRHVPAFLNAVSSVGAMGFQIQRQSEETQRQAAEIQRLELEIQSQKQELIKILDAYKHSSPQTTTSVEL